MAPVDSTHDLSVGVGENSSCLRPHGHCDRFPLPILILPTAPRSTLYAAGTTAQIVVDVPIGLSLTSPKKAKH
jgi:hypothetical protein